MKDFYTRSSEADPWFGPLSFRDALYYARRSTLDGNETDIKICQIGTQLGARGGDPTSHPVRMFVSHVYINGKLVLQGRSAEFHKDKLPIPG